MNIIKVDDLKKRVIQKTPMFAVYIGGRVTLNRSAAQITKAEPGDYLHFFAGDNGQLWIKVDKDPTHGLKIQTNKKNEPTAYCRKLFPYLSPSGEMTRYEVQPDDFGKFKLVKI